MEGILFEFPLTEVRLNAPAWVTSLSREHWLGGAVLSAVEVVNPKIRSTVDAAAMRERLSDRYLIDGPLALDNAIDEAAAHHKGIESPVAGNADILIVPDLWSGNIFSKGLVFFAHLRSAGTLNGLKAPVVMSSRTDTVENKYLSILTAVLQTIL